MVVATPQVRWRSVAAGLAAGEVVAGGVLLLPLFAVAALRILPLNETAHGRTSLEWPFPFDGAWSVVTDLTLLSLLAVAGAPVIALVVAAVAHRRVSARRTAIILLVTGGVPLAWSHGLVPGGVIGFIVAVAAIRYWAIDREERPIGRHGFAGLACAGLAVVISASAYAALHPLRISGSGGGAVPVLVVTNDSRFGVTLESAQPSFPGGAPPLAFGFRGVHAHLAAGITSGIPLYRVRCARGVVGYANVDTVVVRYRVLGRAERQRLTLQPPLQLRCP